MTSPTPSPDATGSPALAALRGMFGSVLHAVLVTDPAGTLTYLNPAVEVTLGRRVDELVGRPVTDLVPRGLTELVAQACAAAEAERPEPVTGIAVARHRDGHDVPLEVRLNPMRDGDDTWLIIGTTDITARQEAERRERTFTQAYLTLAQMNQVIVRAADVTSLFADTCRVAVEFGGYLGAWVGLPGPDGYVAPTATAGRLDDYIGRLQIPLDADDPRGRGPTALALREDRSYYSSQFMADGTTAPWHALAAGFGIAASATMPLHCEGSTVAVLTLYSDRAGVFDEHMRGLLEQLAVNVSYALDGFAARRRLEEVAAQRSELLNRVVTAQESERARIAADVHDESVQALAAVDLRLGLLQRRLREAAPELEASLTPIQETLATATAGLRELLFELEPPAAAGCADAVREVAAHVFEDHSVAWTLTCEEGVALPDVEQVQALRIVKEALINVRKHAGAATVAITIRNCDDGVEVAVTDDGRGFDPEQLPRTPGHRGLATMRDRAELSGGWCRLEPAAAGGTTLRFWIPRAGSGVVRHG